MKEVEFAYPLRPRVNVAKSLTFSAEAGESIALVGPSGLVLCFRLIPLRFRMRQKHNHCTARAILRTEGRNDRERLLFSLEVTTLQQLDGHDHRLIDKTHLRSRIALVGQEPVLFQGTVADNVRLGVPDASIDDVIEACRRANAASFIESLPQVS